MKREDVFRGHAVHFDWIEGLNTFALIHYPKSDDGTSLVYVSDAPILFSANWHAWVFNKINPWEERFEQLIQRQKNAKRDVAP